MPNSSNLINKSTTYIHPKTRVWESGKPTMIHRDVIIAKDVVEYCYSRLPNDISKYKQNLKRDIGAVEYLIKDVEPNVDIIFYSIDRYVAYIHDGSCRFANLLKVQDYMADGIDHYNMVKDMLRKERLTL